MTDYVLAVDEAEVHRYRFMAERARAAESGFWQRAGIGPGAVVADVGCGPAAVAVLIAEAVGPDGRVIGIEPDPAARAAASAVIAAAGTGNVDVRAGSGTRTGIPAGSVDVVMTRHVLAHNGRDEQRIVDHLATLVRPGGSVYLLDIDGTAMRLPDLDPDLDDLLDRYRELHRRRGNDLQVGLRLGRLLTRAGLDVVLHEGWYVITSLPPGLRPPPWAAREAMIAEGVASEDDVRRWAAAFARLDAAPERPTAFQPFFVGIGRRAG